jgi:hypothetical protein
MYCRVLLWLLVLFCTVPPSLAGGYQGVDTEMSFAACGARPGGYANANRVFSGGYGAGCIFSIEEAGGTNMNERIEITARRYMDAAEQQTMVDFVRQSFRQLVGDGDGGLTLQHLGVCDGGLTVLSAADPDHPSTIGYYACGPHLVFVNTRGPVSVNHYVSVAHAMDGLLATTPRPRDMR